MTHKNTFEIDAKFNFSIAILLGFCFVALTSWIIIAGYTEDIGLLTSLSGVFRMWVFWLILFSVILILPSIRTIIYYASCIKHKKAGDDTCGVEISGLATITGVFSIGIGIPELASAVGKYADISLFNTTNFAPMELMTGIIVLLWFILFMANLILSVIAETRYIKSLQKIEDKTND